MAEPTPLPWSVELLGGYPWYGSRIIGPNPDEHRLNYIAWLPIGHKTDGPLIVKAVGMHGRLVDMLREAVTGFEGVADTLQQLGCPNSELEDHRNWLIAARALLAEAEEQP